MAAFQYQSTTKDGITLVKVGGSLDVDAAPRLDAKLGAEISGGAKKIVLNLSRVDYIASAGLGIIASNNGKIKKQGGEMRLSALPDKIGKIFELLSFHKLFRIFKTDEEAIASFSKK
jgi:anti-sigma B factor antagonist